MGTSKKQYFQKVYKLVYKLFEKLKHRFFQILRPLRPHVRAGAVLRPAQGNINMFIFRSSLILLCLCLTAVKLSAAPLVGSVGISYNSTRGQQLSVYFEKHFADLVKITGAFDQVNPQELQSQLADFNLTSEKDRINFAKKAGIQIIAGGSIDDRTDYLKLHLYAIAYDVPHNGNVIANYKKTITLKGKNYSLIKLGFIMEEHTAAFLSMIAKNYQEPVFLTKKNFRLEFVDPAAPASLEKGTYPLYAVKKRSDEMVHFSESGNASYDGSRLSTTTSLYEKEYFICRRFTRVSDYLDDFYYGRKREVVQLSEPIEETAITIAGTPFISILSPVIAPLSYYMTGDFQGLGLWAVNNSPYLYISANAQINNIDKMKDNHENISQAEKGAYYFSYYYFLAAGASMYVDAAAHYANSQASEFNAPVAYMGNSKTALYFSILGNGAGHFYKGHRGWGYLYFHADNLLVLGALYYLSAPEEYNDGTYVSQDADPFTGYMLLGAACGVRVIEVFHALSLNFNIKNGAYASSSVDMKPFFSLDSQNQPVAGLSVEQSF